MVLTLDDDCFESRLCTEFIIQRGKIQRGLEKKSEKTLTKGKCYKDMLFSIIIQFTELLLLGKTETILAYFSGLSPLV